MLMIQDQNIYYDTLSLTCVLIFVQLIKRHSGTFAGNIPLHIHRVQSPVRTADNGHWYRTDWQDRPTLYGGSLQGGLADPLYGPFRIREYQSYYAQNHVFHVHDKFSLVNFI